jgi:hypothetical protein
MIFLEVVPAKFSAVELSCKYRLQGSTSHGASQRGEDQLIPHDEESDPHRLVAAQ